MSLRAEGNMQMADCLKTNNPNVRISDEHALAIFIDAKLKKRSYEIIRSPVTNTYPPYKHVATAKSKCYPPEDSFVVSDFECRVHLQDLLNHTVSRLVNELQDPLNELAQHGHNHYTLILKWGCDGSSGYNEYNTLMLMFF